MPKDLPTDSTEPNKLDVQDDSSQESLSSRGIQSMQGQEIGNQDVKAEHADQAASNAEEIPEDDPMLEEWKKTHDPDNWEYKVGSPHADYQTYKDLQSAKRQHEIGESAATADSLPDAIDTTLKAKNESKLEEENQFDEYFYSKYGRTPYTTDAYPKEDEEQE